MNGTGLEFGGGKGRGVRDFEAKIDVGRGACFVGSSI
jgi:hypothetical protein